MKIFTHSYRLVPRHAMNAVSTGSIREGVLLKVQQDDGSVGYADLHPWVELGDTPLSLQIEALRQGSVLPQMGLSLDMAKKDGQARKFGQSLLASVKVRNNYILESLLDLTPELLDYFGTTKFTTVKIKAGRSTEKELEAIEILSKANLRVRIDFNGSLTAQQFSDFISKLSPEALRSIEYVEDPMKFVQSDWVEANKMVPLAIDNEWSKFDLKDSPPFAVIVLKPAKINTSDLVTYALSHNLKMTVTSYMDHAVGLAHSLVVAQELLKSHPTMMLEAGCFTHNVYQQDDFFKSFQSQGAELKLQPLGTGIGFDGLLKELSWKALV